jgi:hypothetical protein
MSETTTTGSKRIRKTHVRSPQPAPKWAGHAKAGQPWTTCGWGIGPGGVPDTHVVAAGDAVTCTNCRRALKLGQRPERP